MCPAIRFGRFRRLEHQTFWPYTGRTGIKTALSGWQILGSSAFTNTL